MRSRSVLLLTTALAAFFVIAAQTPPKMVQITEVPYLATSNDVAAAMLRLAGVTERDVVYDLGCGDGRIVIMAAQENHARGVGIDINPDLIQRARHYADQSGVGGNVRFEVEDLFETDLHNATVVALYLIPSMNVRLRPKLWKELKVGSRIVSHNWDMGDWPPDKVEDVDGQKIYLWTIRDRR
ncbi:MAG TPA: class I SAM-dependent methyltransferase [Bryobacteraceae bacterium]